MTTGSIRVAMIGQKGYPPVHGGIERHVAELARRLAPQGFHVEIYSRPHYSDVEGTTEISGLVVRRLPSVPTKHFDAITHTVIASLDVLLRRADIVHYHAIGPGLLAWLPRRLAGKRTVVTVHGLDWQREKWGGFARRVLKVGEHASAHWPNRTIVVSQALRDHYLKRHRTSTEYIPNGIVPPVYHKPNLMQQQDFPEEFVLFVARIVPEKGLHFLIRAHGRLPAETRRRFPLIVAGDAGFTPGYADRLRRDAHPEVRFLGFVHGQLLEELYSNATVVVLPSTLEGLSISLLEAMSYGRCCLVSDIPPNLEAAGGFAAVFRSGDADGLEKELAALLAAPARREDLGQRAQLHAIENYSWDRVAARTAQVYRDLMDSASGGQKIEAGG